MRAIQIKDGKGPAENLFLGEAPDPTAGEGQVIVKIHAFALNRMDILQREGRYPPPKGSSEILGVEFSGIISSVGPGVNDRWKVGDEVLGIAGGGAYAEYIAVQQTHVMTKPQHLSWAEAASIPEAFLTAYMAVVMYGELKPGESALVHAAASGVGIAAIQLARDIGAATVTATASTEAKLEWLLSIANGPTHAANYKTQDFSEEVKKTTAGKGVDVVVDFVGQSHFVKNIESLAVDGRMTMLAMLSGTTVSSVNLGPILAKRLRIQGSTLRSRTLEFQAELIRTFRDEFLDKITGGSGPGPIKTYIHRTYSWKDIQDAHREMEANKNIGKIVAEVD